jgi:hypothetical protein
VELGEASAGFPVAALADLTGQDQAPDDEQLRLELARVRTNFRAQTSRVELPRVGDSHCDLASALAAAAWQHDRFGGPGPSPEFWQHVDELAAVRPPAATRGIMKKVF